MRMPESLLAVRDTRHELEDTTQVRKPMALKGYDLKMTGPYRALQSAWFDTAWMG